MKPSTTICCWYSDCIAPSHPAIAMRQEIVASNLRSGGECNPKIFIFFINVRKLKFNRNAECREDGQQPDILAGRRFDARIDSSKPDIAVIIDIVNIDIELRIS